MNQHELKIQLTRDELPKKKWKSKCMLSLVRKLFTNDSLLQR